MREIELKNRLKVARAEKELTQQELADLVGVTRQTISSIDPVSTPLQPDWLY